MITVFSIFFCPDDALSHLPDNIFLAKKLEMFIVKNAQFFLEHYLRLLSVRTKSPRVNVEGNLPAFLQIERLFWEHSEIVHQIQTIVRFILAFTFEYWYC